MFLWPNLDELNNHVIHLKWRLSLNHTPLTVKISILEEYIQTRKRTIVKGSEEEFKLITDVTNLIKSLNTIHISNKKDLECIVQEIMHNTDKIWFKHSKMVNITKHLKLWWNKNCKRYLEIYRASRQLENWKNFKKAVKNTKREFFNAKIQEISNKRKGLWEFMNWVKKRKLPAIEAIKYNRQPCLKINNL